MSRSLGCLAVAVACAACGGGEASRLRGLAGPGAFEATVPRSFEMRFVWRMGRTISLSPIPPRLRVDAAGRPVLLYGDVFVPLRPSDALTPAPPFRLGDWGGLDDAAWMADGTLLVVRDRTLGVVLPEGFVRIADLPAARMHVAPAGPGRAWLFGGEGDLARRLYLYDQSGVVAPVLAAAEPIAAVAGTADRLFVATGGVLLRVTPGDGAVLLHRGGEPIRALALAGDAGVFFTTAAGVFFLREGGASWRVLDEGAEDVQVRGEELYLLFRDAGVLRGSPVSSFATMGGRP